MPDEDLDRLIAASVVAVQPVWLPPPGIKGVVFTLGVSARLNRGKETFQEALTSSGLRESASL